MHGSSSHVFFLSAYSSGSKGVEDRKIGEQDLGQIFLAMYLNYKIHVASFLTI
jgi:hypothetical protein